jgi:hypothetical protein
MRTDSREIFEFFVSEISLNLDLYGVRPYPTECHKDKTQENIFT